MTTREESLASLRRALGRPDAAFREGQWECIAAVLERGRLLVVERTGWGKSMVYFVATRLLRNSGAGTTLLVSPLLALMRNQIAAAQRLGIRAETINSSNVEDWGRIEGMLRQDQVDLLLISPERLANDTFRSGILPRLIPRTGLFVVDEAHCISDWGHDFRPDYRRLVRILELLPASVPVLATTATANDRVVADVAAQLGNLRIHRGTWAGAEEELRRRPHVPVFVRLGEGVPAGNRELLTLGAIPFPPSPWTTPLAELLSSAGTESTSSPNPSRQRTLFDSLGHDPESTISGQSPADPKSSVS